MRTTINQADTKPIDTAKEGALRLRRVPLGGVQENPAFMESIVSRGRSRRNGLLKRGFDIAVAIMAGIPMVPLLAVLGLAIRIDSRGPVFYCQSRLGMNNSIFTIYKLRTMYVSSEDSGAQYASKDDPRVTRVGRVLRATRLDEIPQLINILKGEMSLIGPRPERPENLEILELAIPYFSARTIVRPGITGWAQVSSVNYAATIEETSLKVEYDFYYLAFGNWRLDLMILIRTIGVVFNRKGL